MPKAKAADTAKSATAATTATSAGTATTATTATNATNATNAADAAKLGGKSASEYVTTAQRKIVFQKLNDGQTVELIAIGGAAPTDFLQPDTAEADRDLLSNTAPAGGTNVENDIDQGIVTAPDGTTLSINGEGWALGLNFAGTKCFVAGTVSVITP